MDAVLVGARADVNHVYLQRAVMEALLPIVTDQSTGPSPLLPDEHKPAVLQGKSDSSGRTNLAMCSPVKKRPTAMDVLVALTDSGHMPS